MKFNTDQYKAPLIEKSNHKCKCNTMGSDLYSLDVRSCSSVETSAPCTVMDNNRNQSLGSAREPGTKWRTLSRLSISPCCTCFLNTVYTGDSHLRKTRKSLEKSNGSKVKGRNWLPCEEWLHEWGFFSLKKRVEGGGGLMRGWSQRDGLPNTSSKTVQWANREQAQSKLKEVHFSVMWMKLWYSAIAIVDAKIL